MTPSPINHIALHVDETMPVVRHFSKVFHRTDPSREIATFCDPVTHAADAQAFINMSLARDGFDQANWLPAKLFAPMLGQMASHGYRTCGTGATLSGNHKEDGT